MRKFQFWTLVLGSSLVSLLMIKQIFLSRELNQEQSVLISSEETAASAQTYQTAWQKLATAIYQASRQDPAFAAVLKNSAVEIHTKPTQVPGGTSVPPSSLPSAPAKAPVAP